MQIGDIVIADAILTLELRIGTLEKSLNRVIALNGSNLKLPSQDDIKGFEQQTLREIKSKYPNNGIEVK